MKQLEDVIVAILNYVNRNDSLIELQVTLKDILTEIHATKNRDKLSEFLRDYLHFWRNYVNQ